MEATIASSPSLLRWGCLVVDYFPIWLPLPSPPTEATITSSPSLFRWGCLIVYYFPIWLLLPSPPTEEPELPLPCDYLLET
ncbi:hypothetical protein LINGRAHAP2_LOCUS31493 [Linum grandiflorum]